MSDPLARRLAIVRVAIGLTCLWALLSHPEEVPGLGAEPGAVFRPVGLARVLPAPLPPAAIAVWQGVTVLLGVAWTLGWSWRATAPAFAAAFLGWATWRLCWGAIAHDLHLLTVHLIAVAFLPAAGALSLDARRATPSRLAWVPEGAVAEVWARGGVRLVSALTVTTYALAGLAKVGPSGAFTWARGTNLADHLTISALVALVYRPQDGLPAGFSFLLDHPTLLALGAPLTLVLELGAPLALVHRYAGVTWAVGIFAMHVGIAGAMNVVFPYPSFGLAFLSFLPVERLLRRGVSTRPSGT